MNLPLFVLSIDDLIDDPAQVEYVALVDKPAIQKNFLAFKETICFDINEEKQIITGPLMLADFPIYRNDDKGEYYVTFPKDTIESIVKKFFAKGFQFNVNEMHDPSKKVEGVYMYESWMVDRTLGKMPMKGFEDAKDGSWFGSFKVDNPDVWQKIKAKEFQGFSVEGIFNMKPVTKEEQLVSEIKNILNQIAA